MSRASSTPPLPPLMVTVVLEMALETLMSIGAAPLNDADSPPGPVTLPPIRCRAIFTLASKAQAAADWMHTQQPEQLSVAA